VIPTAAAIVLNVIPYVTITTLGYGDFHPRQRRRQMDGDGRSRERPGHARRRVTLAYRPPYHVERLMLEAR
jgi:hypothetical protein